MKENQENEVAMTTKENYSIVGFNDIGNNSTTRTQVITNITDVKRLFNLENNVDAMLNDCEGKMIRVKEVLIKQYEKPLKKPIINEETGEIEKDTEYSMSCVLVDDAGKSYATGSKMFIIQLKRYLQMASRTNEKLESFDIKIIKKKISTGNKVLSFELV